MTRRQVLKLVLLPVVTGLLAVGGAYAVLERAQPSPDAQVQVVTAARVVPARSTLAAEDLVLRPVPPSLAGPEALTDLGQAAGRVTLVPLVPGEMVMRSKLMTPGSGDAGLSAEIPAGYRAVTMAADEVSGVAGLLQPGDRVDVMATFPPEVAGQHKTRLLLEDVQVLAVGRTREARPASREPRADVPRSITLAVTPEQAVALTLAAQTGHIRLALRPLGGEWTRGEIELSTAAFASGRSARLPAQGRPSFAARILAVEVEVGALARLGLQPGWSPGVRGGDAGTRAQLESLLSAGKAWVVAQGELLAGPGGPARWQLWGSIPVSGGGQLAWLGHGLSLEVNPIGAQDGGWALRVVAELRYVDVPAAGTGGASHVAAHPLSEVRPSAERLEATLALPPDGVALVHGLVTGERLAAPDGYVRLALPRRVDGGRISGGQAELLLAIVPRGRE